MPTDVESSTWETIFSSNYELFDLKEIMGTLGNLFAKHEVKIGSAILNKEFHKLLSQPNLKKKAPYVALMSRIFSTEQGRKAVFDSFPIEYRDILATAIENKYVDPVAQEDLHGLKLVAKTSTNYYSYRIEHKGIIAYFKTVRNRYYPQLNDPVYLPEALRNAWKPYIFSEPQEVFPDSFPPETGLVTFNGEREIPMLLTVLRQLEDDDVFEVKGVSVTASSANKGAKLMDCVEPFASSETTALKKIRKIGLANLFHLACYYGNLNNTYKNYDNLLFYKEVINRAFEDMEVTIAQALHFMNPGGFSMLNNSTYWVLLEFVKDFLKTDAADGKWISREKLRWELLNYRTSYRLAPVLNYDTIINRYIADKYSGRSITLFNNFDTLAVNGALSLIGLFAAGGLIEIVYEQANGNDIAYEAIRYFRLTDLGRYLLGITYEYRVAKADVSELFEFDVTTGVILALGEQNPYEKLIAQYAEKVGSRRYKFTRQSVIGAAINVEGVRANISSIYNILGDCIPQPISDFLEQIAQDCGHVRKATKNFTVLDCDLKDTRLLDVIMNDDQLRTLTRRIEGGSLLVKDKDLPQVRQLLQSHGFLI